jgi:hypothetical protein
MSPRALRLSDRLRCAVVLQSLHSSMWRELSTPQLKVSLRTFRDQILTDCDCPVKGPRIDPKPLNPFLSGSTLQRDSRDFRRSDGVLTGRELGYPASLVCLASAFPTIPLAFLPITAMFPILFAGFMRGHLTSPWRWQRWQDVGPLARLK